MKKRELAPQGQPRLLPRTLLVLGAAGLTLAACNTKDLLTVPDPDVVKPAALEGPTALPNVLAATIGDFQVAYGGSNGGTTAIPGASEGQIQMSGLLADELINSESFPTRIEVDQRNTNPINATMLNIFRDIEKARVTSEDGERRYEKLDSTNFARPEVVALNGYTYDILAENYCSGVPASSYDPSTGVSNFGAPLTTAQLLTIASAKFDTAITLAAAAGNKTVLNLASVGKGRVLVDQGNYAAAAAAVAAVPSTFRYVINHDENTARQNNGVFSFAQNSRRFSIPDREGVNGLPFRSDGVGASGDPRLAVRRNATSNGNGFDNQTPLYVTAKYPNRSAPSPLAEATEARLIEAEAALATGNDSLFLRKLNEARAQAFTYAVPPNAAPPKPSPLKASDIALLTPAGKVDLLFKERAYNLFLTSHRLGDLRRLIRQYGRDSESVFPTGAYFKGGIYGTDVNFPVPFEEQNNPSFTGCLDRKA